MRKYFKTILSTVLSYLMVVSMFPIASVNAHAASYTGNGTETNPFIVSTGAELVEVFANYNTPDVYIELDNNITLDETYVPIYFKGHFDGNFYKITAKTNFLYTNSGTVKNFYYVATVTRVDGGSGMYGGLICDQNSGVISGVIATGHLDFACGHGVTSDGSSEPSEVGMIAGSGGTIINCAAFGSIRTYCPYGSRAAGISITGTVMNCYAAVDVKASGSSKYGSSNDDPISFGRITNSFYNKEIYTAEDYGLTASEMKTSDFVSTLNSKPADCDSKWVRDTSNKNSGYPILTRILNASITSSKTNIIIQGTESVSLTCSDTSAKIYYTLNGSTPSTSSYLYSSPISISSDTVLKTVAYKNGYYSNVFTFNFAKILGEGTAASPYRINSEAALNAVNELKRDKLNDVYYILTNDIYMSNEMPHLGDFYGMFDGQGYTISNVYSANIISGIFNANYGIIENLNLKVKSNNRFTTIAGLVSENYGLIYNCNVEGYLFNSISTYFGGIVAENFGTLERCSFDGYIHSLESSMAGGIVGYNAGKISSCIFNGEVNIYSVYWYAASDLNMSSWQGYVGGFVGYNNGGIYSSIVNASRVYSASRDYTGVKVGAFVGGFTNKPLGCSANVDSVIADYFILEWGVTEANYYCTDRNDSSLSPENHKHNFTVSLLPPKCGELRYYEYKCSICDLSYSSKGIYDDYYYIGHDYFEAECIITKNATCSEHGEYVRYCNTCNYADTFDVLPTSHNEMVLVDPNLYPESLHEYDNEVTETDVFTYPGASQLQITFSSLSKIGYKDHLYIYDGSDKYLYAYTDQNLDAVTITIPGDTVKFKLVPSGGWTYYGYSLSYIYADCPKGETLVDKSLYPESSHDYANYTNETKTFSYPGATELSVKFSENTKVESRYDFIYLYDGNNNQIGKYTDVQLAGQTITIPGDTFKIKLTSDSSYTYYGYSFDSIVAKSVHDNWEITKENNCTENGEKKRTCSLCGEEVVKEIPALGHTRETIPAVPATCTETGLTSGTKCSVCKEILVAQQMVAAKGHKYTAEETITTTCTQDGLITYTCSSCGDSYTETIPAYNHNLGEVLIDKSKYPESQHNYTNNLNQTKTLSWPGAKKLIVTFSASTKTESCDYIYLYDANDKLVGSYSGTSLAGKKIVISGDTFKITLKTDHSVVYYGYSFDSIVADMGGYGVWQTASNSTCVEKGTEKRVCSLCGKEETREIPELGHNMIEYDEVLPDCTNTGMTAGSQCSRCEHKVGLEVVPELGHDMVEQIRIEPDCINAGMTEGAQCSRCDHKVGLENIPSLGHDMIIDPAVEPDCVNTGLTEGSHCSRCENKIEQDVIPELGHDMVEHNKIEADCTNSGMTEGAKCSRCDHKVGLEVIPELGHDMVSFDEVAPDCLNTGITAGSQCSRCEHKVGLEVIPSLGHDMVEYSETAPGCTSDGATAGSQCSRCDHKTGREVIPAYNHNAPDYLIISSKYPESLHNYENGSNETKTFTWTGANKLTVTFSASTKVENNYDKIYLYDGNENQIGVYTDVALAGKSITINGDTVKIKLTSDSSVSYYGYSITSIIADMGGYGSWQTAKEPGCVENGIEKKICSICGAEEINELPSLGGHVEGEKVIENSVGSTCGATGSYEEAVYCTVCDEELSRESFVTDKLPHIEEIIPARVPTCTETGLTEGVKCSACGDILTAPEEVPSLGHSYDEGVVTKESACEEKGTKTFTCIACGDTYTEEIAALSHTEETIPAVEPVCTAVGYTAGVKCAVCGEILTAPEEVPALGHSYDEGVVTKESACEEKGTKTFTCIACGDTYTEEIAALSHTEETIPAVEPVCTAVGYTAGVKCAVCGEILTAPEEVPALGHSYDEGVVTKESACEGKGTKTFTCIACGDTYTEEIAALSHTEEIIPAVEPVCTAVGYTAGVKCAVCGEILTAPEEVPALGHNYDRTKSEENLTRPTETSDGYYTYTCKNNCDATETEPVKRADYSAYDEVFAKLNGYLESSEITDKAKQDIYGELQLFALDNGYTDKNGNLRKDLTEAEQNIVDNATAFAENLASEVEKKISSGEIVKADYTEIDEKIKAVDDLLKNNLINDEMKAEFDDIKSDLEELKKDTDASKADVADAIAALAERIDRILSTIECCANGNHLFTVYSTVEEAKCESEGKKVAVCDYGCGTEDEKAIEPTGHTEEVIPATAPDCTGTGFTEGVKCSVCDKILTAQETVESLGHTAGNPVVENATDATCGVAGSYEEVVYCKVCGVELSREFKTVDSIPHSYDNGVETTAPTCTENGVKVFTCSVCGDRYTETVPALNHNIVIDEAVDATCTSTGLTEGQHCSNCDGATVEQEIVPVKPHDYSVKYDSSTHWKECTCGFKSDIQNHTFDNDSVCSCGYKRVVESTIKISNNSGSRSINYGETLKLTANVTNKPANAKIYWYVDDVKAGEGETFSLSFENGSKTVTVKLVDENGVVYQNASGNEIKDSESVTVNGGFFRKLISFFKNLFGMNRIVVQAIFKGTF